LITLTQVNTSKGDLEWQQLVFLVIYVVQGNVFFCVFLNIFFIFNIFIFFKILKAAGEKSTIINISKYPGLWTIFYTPQPLGPRWAQKYHLCSDRVGGGLPHPQTTMLFSKAELNRVKYHFGAHCAPPINLRLSLTWELLEME
jgi:hypothetical protein